MYFSNILLVLGLAFLGSCVARPQDAEFIPPTVPRRDSPVGGSSDDDGFGIVYVRPVVSDFDTLMRNFWSMFQGASNPSFGSPGVDSSVSSIFPFNRRTGPQVPSTPDFPFSFPFDFPRLPSFPRIPDIIPEYPNVIPDLDSLPDNYDNSTYEVKVVNGTKMEVNTTITKNRDDNGVFVQEVHIIRYTPEKEEEEETPVVPEVSINETQPQGSGQGVGEEMSLAADYEDFGLN